MLQRFMSRFSVDFFLSHSTEKFRRGNFVCFTKFLVWKKNMDKRGGGRKGASQFFVEIFLSHSTELFCRRNLLCCVSEDFR